jgi:hypothetical protein
MGRQGGARRAAFSGKGTGKVRTVHAGKHRGSPALQLSDEVPRRVSYNNLHAASWQSWAVIEVAQTTRHKAALHDTNGNG